MKYQDGIPKIVELSHVLNPVSRLKDTSTAPNNGYQDLRNEVLGLQTCSLVQHFPILHRFPMKQLTIFSMLNLISLQALVCLKFVEVYMLFGTYFKKRNTFNVIFDHIF